MISSEDLVACICEGNSEKAIIEILLKRKLLKFNRDQLLEDEILTGKYRRASVFTDRYLQMDYGGKKLIVLSVQDSKKASFTIKPAYTHQIKSSYFVITAPEIEMLMIHAAGLYDEYQKVKSSKKPSEFVCESLKKKSAQIKNTKFINDFFERHDLVDAIKNHKTKSTKFKKSNQIFLHDLIIEG